MKIICTNTGETIKFGDLISRWQDKYPGIVNRRWLTLKLLNNESVFVENKEYKREVEGENQ